MFSTYSEALNYLYTSLPIFQRVGASAYRADLTNTIELCKVLNHPEARFKSIHIAGTNGKGSTSHMLASVLQSAGYKTGLYTSPHLKDFTERIKVNGEEVSKDFVLEFVNRIQSEIERIKPSFFEITVVMAFEYFVRQQVDVAVIEVGLGGRLDSTNVITPEVSLITNIGWDHKDILGDTLDKIAFEKAGVIKPSIPVVISERQENIQHIFESKTRETQSSIFFASDEFVVVPKEQDQIERCDIYRRAELYVRDVKLPLHGLYQKKNVPGVLKAIELLNTKGFKIGTESIVHGLENAVTQTNLKGRWQKLGEQPLIICDTGHNLDGVGEVVRQINLQKFSRLHIVWGAVKDKDITEILRLLPTHASYYFCEAKIPRALDATTLFGIAEGLGLRGVVVPDVNEALSKARTNATTGDMIFIGGSTFVVAEINEL